MTRRTSVDTYHKIEAEGLLSKRRWAVYSALYANGPATATAIANELSCYKSPSVGANVHARLGELRAAGCVYEVGETICQHTNQTVILWDVTEALPLKVEITGLTKSELIDILCSQLEEILPRVKVTTEEGQAWLDKTLSIISECAEYRKKNKVQ